MKERWSYKVERVKLPLFSGVEANNKVVEEALNRRGQEGWELVHSLPSNDWTSMSLYLKKPM
jgi:hypothetical protein